jgi:hypothetical protein
MKKILTGILLLLAVNCFASPSPISPESPYIFKSYVKVNGDSFITRDIVMYNLHTYPTCPTGRRCLAYVNDTLRENTGSGWHIFKTKSLQTSRSIIMHPDSAIVDTSVIATNKSVGDTAQMLRTKLKLKSSVSIKVNDSIYLGDTIYKKMVYITNDPYIANYTNIVNGINSNNQENYAFESNSINQINETYSATSFNQYNTTNGVNSDNQHNTANANNSKNQYNLTYGNNSPNQENRTQGNFSSNQLNYTQGYGSIPVINNSVVCDTIGIWQKNGAEKARVTGQGYIILNVTDTVWSTAHHGGGSGTVTSVTGHDQIKTTGTTSITVGLKDSTGSGKPVLQNSPAFTGTPTATTQAQSDSSTRLATTKYIRDGLAQKEPLITKSTGFLAWTGAVWSFINQTFLQTSDTSDRKKIITRKSADSIYAKKILSGSNKLMGSSAVWNNATSITLGAGLNMTDSTLNVVGGASPDTTKTDAIGHYATQHDVLQKQNLLSSITGTNKVAVGGTATAKFEIHSPSGGANTGLKLTLDANGTATTYFPLLEASIPTTGLSFQMLQCPSNYSNNTIYAKANSTMFLNEASSGELFFAAAGTSGRINLNTGGYDSTKTWFTMTKSGKFNMGSHFYNPQGRVGIRSPNGGSNDGLALIQVADHGTPAQSFFPIDIRTQYGLMAQFLFTGPNYVNSSIALRQNSLGIITYSDTGNISLIVGGRGSINFNTSGIGSANTRMKIDSIGNVGIGTLYPHSTLSFSGQSMPTISPERNTTSNTSGTGFTLGGGGGTSSGATDKGDAGFYIKPLTTTGTGNTFVNIQRRTRAATTGTSDNTLSDALIIPSVINLTNNSAVNLFDVSLPVLSGCGGSINYSVEINDGTDIQQHSGHCTYAAVNKGGVYTSQIQDQLSTSDAKAVSTGTLTDTWAIVNGTNKITITVNFNSSLTPAVMKLRYTIINNSGQTITLY